MTIKLPSWLNPESATVDMERITSADVESALCSDQPGIKEFAALLSSSALDYLEVMAQKAQAITRRHFGRTISLYVPLYLANYCSGGCVYCGFASDREQPRRRLEEAEFLIEIDALKEKGFDDILLLTGERSPEADFDYLLNSVSLAAKKFHNVAVESFAMSMEEYRKLSDAGCTGITLYQETYHADLYKELHRWGTKKDYAFRVEAPARALQAGLRMVGLGVLLGLGEPVYDALSLFQHARYLQKKFWRSGVMISFPRICAQQGGFQPEHHVDDSFLARMIFAFRICLPDVPLILSTREREKFRDGMAGVGISRMSVESKTTVGGYFHKIDSSEGQFDVNDKRDVKTFCEMLGEKGLEPVFKNWDSVFQQG
ncbi:2-iminoacetate synthase ThiH [Verrucomicrobiota bacterium]